MSTTQLTDYVGPTKTIDTVTTRPIFLDRDFDHRSGGGTSQIELCQGEYVEVEIGPQDHCATDYLMIYTDGHSYSYSADVTVDDFESDAGWYCETGDFDD